MRSGRASPAFRAVLAALAAILEEGGPAASRVVFVTIAWGQRLARYLPSVLQRARALGRLRQYVVFCLDDAFCDACRAVHLRPELCVRGRLKTIFNKYTVVSSLVHVGFDVVYLDFDTLLLRDPLPPILGAAEEAEILVARDFGGECLNTGVIYFKAHASVASFLRRLLSWLWHHPYEFSQKAFAGFLGREQVAMWRSPAGEVPRWAVLDPWNAFVTSVVYNRGVEGWTGDLEGIVVYHFLDGTGGVDASLAEAGRYVNLYDLFFANPRLDLADASVPLWRQDPEVERHLLSTRLPSPPTELQPCSLLVDGES